MQRTRPLREKWLPLVLAVGPWLLGGCGLLSGPRVVVTPTPRACRTPGRKYQPPAPGPVAGAAPAVQVQQPQTQPTMTR